MEFHELVAHIQLLDSFSEVLKLSNGELASQYFSGKTPVGPFGRCLQRKEQEELSTVTIDSLVPFLLFCQKRLSRVAELSIILNMPLTLRPASVRSLDKQTAVFHHHALAKKCSEVDVFTASPQHSSCLKMSAATGLRFPF